MGAINELGSKVGAIYKDGIKYSGVITSGDTPSPSTDVPLEDKDVIFIDYDGTVLYGYSVEEFLALTEMPANPDHTSEGLVSQGWNWTLQDAQDYVEDHGTQVIGQMYDTYDGNTRLYLSIPNDGNYDKEVRFSVNSSVASTSNPIVVDWGDGDSTNVTTTGAKALTHIYSTYGDYVITISNQNTTGTCVFACSDDTVSYTNSHGLDTFLTDVRIGSTTFTSISKFRYFSNLTTITFPLPVRTMEFFTINSIFRYCSSLQAIIIPRNFETVTSTTTGTYAFAYCTSLKYFSIPKTFDTFNTAFFSYASGLKRFCFPDTTTSIPNNMFEKCSSLEKIVLPANPTSIGSSAFRECTSLTKLIIPDSVTSLGTYAFYECAKLSTLILSDAISQIPTYAFSYCISLTQVELPSSLTSISGNSFQYCTGLKELVVPSTTTSIGNNVFTYTYSLTRLYMLPTTPPSISSSTISSSTINRADKIIVPHGCGEAYKAATNWSTYADFIVEMDE